jgi:hypothetical protein
LGPFQGCGIYNDTGGTVNLTNCTIASNQGTAGVRNRDGAVNARNTIIARNNSADFNGTLTSQGYNFIQNASGTTVVPAQSTDQIGLGLDAMLGPLQDNGGPTFTRALLNGSPAIDKGGPVAGIITDQRGMPRPIRYNSSITEPSGGDGSDIGAFEVSPIQFGAANYSANEDAGSVTLTVTRSGDTSKGATVHYQTSDGTATAGSDYNSASGDLTFASDEISKDIVITLNDDNVYEGDETFRITLSAPVGADLGLSVATVTILENEAAPPTPTPTATPTATPPKALNISTRSRVETGDNVLIGGMIVTGNVSKSVIFRALGPSLLGSGIPGALPDPTLELRDAANNLIAFNDNWQDLQKQQIQDTGLAPKNDLDSAIVIRLDPNRSYTAIVRGKNGEVGVALVEAYDLEEGADSRLANISSRAFVQTNDNVLIAGFIIGGAPSTSAKLVLRGLGPSLADVGITNPLQDPTMVAYDANGNTVGANDDWKQGQQPEIVAAGLAPKDDRESALYLQLGPGNYTAIVGGKNNATGAGLVEVYNVP